MNYFKLLNMLALLKHDSAIGNGREHQSKYHKNVSVEEPHHGVRGLGRRPRDEVAEKRLASGGGSRVGAFSEAS